MTAMLAESRVASVRARFLHILYMPVLAEGLAYRVHDTPASSHGLHYLHFTVLTGQALSTRAFDITILRQHSSWLPAQDSPPRRVEMKGELKPKINFM